MNGILGNCTIRLSASGREQLVDANSRISVPFSSGVEIVDAAEAYFPPPPDPERWVPSVPTDLRWYTKSKLEDHVDYRPNPIHEFNWRTKLVEGNTVALGFMADVSIGWRPFKPVKNGQRWTFETSDVTWPQKSTMVYTLNPELMHRSIITYVQMY